MSVVFSIVVPVFNEEAVAPILLRRLDWLLASLDEPSEVILVDDGSRDCSSIVLRAKAKDDPRYRYLRLSRNFGHQIAITAGLDVARGDAAIIMDGDLQDPPEIALELVAKWREGFEIVSAQRVARSGEGWFKRATAHLFYRVTGRLASIQIPMDVGDFRLVDRKAIDCFKAMRERERYVRGMFAWIGFRHALVPFERAPRAAGTTKYSLVKMMRLASNGLVSFSQAPLLAALWVGFAVSVLAILYGAYVIGLRFTNSNLVPGWSSSIVVTAFLSGVNLMMTGVMGLYVGRIYTEVKGRPLYLVDSARSVLGVSRNEDEAPSQRIGRDFLAQEPNRAQGQ